MSLIRKLKQNKTVKKILKTGVAAATAITIGLSSGVAIDTLIDTKAKAETIAVSTSYRQNPSTKRDIYGTRFEAESDGLLLRADHIFSEIETTKWGVRLPYRINDITANIELFGIDDKLQNGLGTRLRLNYKILGFGGIFQNYRTASGESQLFGPQFFIDLQNFQAQAGVYKYKDSTNNLEDVISNGVFSINFNRQAYAAMWNVSNKNSLIGFGAASLPKAKGKGFGYMLIAEYQPELEKDFESLHLLWGSTVGPKTLLAGMGIMDNGDSEKNIFPIATDFPLDAAGVGIWFLPWTKTEKAGLRIKHFGDPLNHSDTIIGEAAIFPFNMYNGPKALRKFFVGGIVSQSRANGESKKNLMGATGYSYGPIEIYFIKSEGQAPAGYLTFKKAI